MEERIAVFEIDTSNLVYALEAVFQRVQMHVQVLGRLRLIAPRFYVHT